MPHFGASQITGPAAAQTQAAIREDWPAVSLYRWRPQRHDRQLKHAHDAQACALCARAAAPGSAYCPYCRLRVADPRRDSRRDPRRVQPAGNLRVMPR